MDARTQELRRALCLLEIPWRDDSVLIRGYCTKASSISLGDLLWASCEMHFLKTKTQFDVHRKRIYDEIAQGPFVPKRGLVSERAKRRVLEENTDAYNTYRTAKMEVIRQILLEGDPVIYASLTP